MAVVRKKQDDKILKTLRELVSIGGNKECFDCGQKGPTYINMTIGSFVCTTCSGILRGITPPHRVKSISMATFTQEEIDFVRQNGNDACSRTWLGLWDPKRAIKQEHRDFMIDKYERKRYYLEPASPLKSLPTNGTTSTTAASTLASATNGNGSSTNIHSSTSTNSSSSKNGAENLVPLKTITLTPPTSLRLSRTSSNSSGGLANGSNGSHTGSSTNLKFQQQFTPDDSNFFSSDPPKILPPTPQKHSSNHHQRLNGTTVNGSTFERNQKNGLLTSTTTANGINPANKFTPDTDFVADFSNANIIVNATNPVTATTTAATANGLKNGSNHHRLSNGFSSENGNGLIPNGHRNGNGGETENFADFEHNTIYNAAEQHSSGSLNLSIDSGNSTTASSSSTTSVNSLNNDLFINNYSLLNNNNGVGPAVGGGGGGDAPTTFGSPQFVAFSGGGVFGQPQRPPSNTGYSYFQNCPQHQNHHQHQHSGSSSLNFVTSANGQWNLGWPQWGAVPHDQQQQQQKPHNCTNQNRWSLPISASSRSSSALSSATPSVDRYAALKDLDDQFREIKFESETNNNNVISSSASTNGLSNGLMNGNHTNDVHQVSTANPFKTANPFQQQPQQPQTLSWAIPGSTPPTATNGFYASSSSSPYQNGFVHPAAATAANLLNGNGVNGFTNAFHQHHPSSNGSTLNGVNNNGYGHIQTGGVPPYGVHHGGSVNHFGHFGNPFMAAGATTATSNSNNPFL